jgi:HTH-type transcriptional regulator/antitoxin HigA
VADYSRQKLEEALPKLKLLAHVPQEIRHVPKVLSDAGVRFVVVQPLQGSKIDGACFPVNDNPAIALTLRFDRIDNFWFVLMHEIGHLLNGDHVSFDSELEARIPAEEIPEPERRANEFAKETLISQSKLESFIARIAPLYSQRRVEAFAQSVKVHPGIVVGQLQHRGEISYSTYRKTLQPVREWVTNSTLTDGWGSTPPAGL